MIKGILIINHNVLKVTQTTLHSVSYLLPVKKLISLF